MSGIKAMILAAGLGTRLKPFTDNHPKALAPVNGKPLLQRNIEYLMGFGVHNFIINTHHFYEQIIEFLKQNDDFGSEITISHEADQPLETGGGLLHAAWFFKDDKEPFIMMNADILTTLDIQKMYTAQKQLNPLVTVAVTRRKSSRNFLFDENNLLCGWRNNKTGELKMVNDENGNLHPASFSGIHIISPEIFPLITQRGKFSIIDAYLELAKTKQIRAWFHDEDIFIDAGKPEAILEAEKYFK